MTETCSVLGNPEQTAIRLLGADEPRGKSMTQSREQHSGLLGQVHHLHIKKQSTGLDLLKLVGQYFLKAMLMPPSECGAT